MDTKKLESGHNEQKSSLNLFCNIQPYLILKRGAPNIRFLWDIGSDIDRRDTYFHFLAPKRNACLDFTQKRDAKRKNQDIPETIEKKLHTNLQLSE
jgi:hypothetical protein